MPSLFDTQTMKKEKDPGITTIENVNAADVRWSKSLATEFSIAICRPTGDTWQSKTLMLSLKVDKNL